MQKTVYKVQKYSLRPQVNGAFDAWVNIGSPDPINSEEYQIITHLSGPSYKTDMKDISDDGKLNLSIELAPHEVVVVQIVKR